MDQCSVCKIATSVLRYRDIICRKTAIVPIVPLTHTEPHPNRAAPTAERALRLVARDLRRDQVLAPHSHPFGQITYAREGVIQVIADASTWFVPPLRAIWIPPNIVHEVHILETARLRALHSYPGVVALPDSHCVVLEVSPLLRELILAMELDDAPGPREDNLVQVVLDELRHAQALPMKVAIPRDKRLKSLCEKLMADPASDMTLEQHAEHAGASARTLARLFEQELGLSFGLWRQHLRLALATAMIANGMPLARVAGELGYASQSAFSAMFKKTLGKSPSAFYRDR